MISPRLILTLAVGILVVYGAHASAATLPWTRTITFFSALPELEKQCTKDGGIGQRICYNKDNDYEGAANRWTTWSEKGCPKGYTPALWCKAPAAKTTTTTTTTKPPTSPTTTKAPATAAPATTQTTAAKTDTATGGTAPQTATGGVAPQTAGGGTAPQTAGGGVAGANAGPQVLKNPLKFDSLPELMTAILDAIVELGAILLVFMLVWVGFLFVTAQGNPEKISSARSALIWTLIGGVILLAAEAISKVIEATVSAL